MALTLVGLENLLKSADFRIEALNAPTSPGQPQVFQIRPSALQILPELPSLPNPGGNLDIPPIPLGTIDIPSFSISNTVPPEIDIPAFDLPEVDIPPIPLPPGVPPVSSLFPTADILNAIEQVGISVDWQVEDFRGAPVSQDRAILWPGKKKTPQRGGPAVHESDIAGVSDGFGAEVETLAPSLQTTVMVLPDFVDLVRDFPPLPVKTLYLSATVTLSYQGMEAKLTLPRFPITVPSIPIPTLAVFFAKPNLGVDPNGALQSDYQFALIVVPKNSPIGDIPALRAILKTLADIMQTVDTIKTVAGLTGDVLPALSSLTGAAATLLRALNLHVPAGEVGVSFVAADRILKLNNVDMILRNIVHNDTEAEDEISSLVFMAPPGRQLLCRRDRNLTGRGIRIETGDACIAIVNQLVKPFSVLPEAVGGLNPPKVHVAAAVSELNDDFSSIAFL